MSDQAEPREQAAAPPEDQIVETRHAITIAGQEIRYTVRTGTLVLRGEREGQGDKAGAFEGDQPRAAIFFVAYTRDDVADPATRPLTFSFNGGPGSSSVWLHLGLLGPRRVLMADDGTMLPPPFRLVDNPHSLLDETDLVFIDPVSTGFSRPVVGEKAREFHGLRQDIEAVGDFIRLWTTRYGRWASPKLLIGESYGTTRAAGLAGYLQSRHGMYLNGIMLISSVLDFMTLAFDPGNDLPAILYLPSYAATAWFHGRLDRALGGIDQVLAAAEEFALGDYATALLRGSSLPARQRRRVVARLAELTGLSPAYLERVNLRPEINRFTKELLRDQRRSVGRLDSRFTGIDRDAAGEHGEYDPSLTGIMGPYTATLNDYLRRELRFSSDLPYEVLNPKVWPWSYSDHENRYVNVAEILRNHMTINPFLKVFVASGIYDLATPYFATDYTVSHLGLAEELVDNVTVRRYQAGHMMYIHLPSLIQQKADLAAFIRAAVPAKGEA